MLSLTAGSAAERKIEEPNRTFWVTIQWLAMQQYHSQRMNSNVYHVGLCMPYQNIDYLLAGGTTYILTQLLFCSERE